MEELDEIQKLATEIADMMHPTVSRFEPPKIREMALRIVDLCADLEEEGKL